MITNAEAKKLQDLRKLRNPFVHVSNPKDETKTEESALKISQKLSERIAYINDIKKESHLEKDAKKAIRLFS